LLVPGASSALTKDIQYTKTPVQPSGGISQFKPASQICALAGQSSNNTATFFMLWDQQNLYIGADVKDTALFCNALPADSGVAWSNDGVELNFDIKNKKSLSPGDQDFRQWILPINWNNNAYDAYGSGSTGDTSFSGTAKVNVQLEGTLNDSGGDTGFKVVVAIPWSDLGITPKNDLIMGLDLAVNDRDGLTGDTTFMDWANLQTYAQPDKWNSIKLVGGPATPPPSDGTPTPKDTGPTTDWYVPPAGDQPMNTGDPVWTRPKDDFSCDCAVGSPPAGGKPQLLLVLLALLWFYRRR
jgi:MYXO-CTERM domain-containing protein